MYLSRLALLFFSYLYIHIDLLHVFFRNGRNPGPLHPKDAHSLIDLLHVCMKKLGYDPLAVFDADTFAPRKVTNTLGSAETLDEANGYAASGLLTQPIILVALCLALPRQSYLH
jgi:hypothetical protein